MEENTNHDLESPLLSDSNRNPNSNSNDSKTKDKSQPTAYGDSKYYLSFIALCLVGLLDSIEYGVVMPSLFGYLKELDKGHSDATKVTSNYGLIVSIFSAASMATKPLLGYIGDSRPFAETFIWTTLVASVGSALYTLAPYVVENIWVTPTSYVWVLLISRILSGVGCANTSLTFAYVARTVSSDKRTKYMTYLSLLRVLGFSLGPACNLITGIMVFNIGPIKVNEFNSPGIFVVVVQIFAVIYIAMFLKEPPPYATKTKTQTSTLNGSSVETSNTEEVDSTKLIISWPLILCFINIFAYNFFFTVFESVVTPTAQASFHWNPLQISYVYMAVTLLATVHGLAQIKLSGSIEDRTFMMYSGIFSTLGPLLCWWFFYFDMNPLVMWVCVIIWTTPLSAMFSSNRSLFSRLVEHTHKQALLSSALSILASVGGIVAPNWVGLTFGKYPDSDAKQPHKHVAPITLFGCAIFAAIVMVLNYIVLYLMPTDLPILALKKGDKETKPDTKSEVKN